MGKSRRAPRRDEASARAWDRPARRYSPNGYFVPPYSPDTNPIEMAFAKIKHHVRKAQAKTQSELRSAFRDACATITPRDARNYINHAYYF